MQILRSTPKRVGLVVSLLVGLLSAGTGSLQARQTSGSWTLYPNSPVLTVGEEGAWDSDAVIVGDMVLHEGFYHLFYSGSSYGKQTPYAVGHATSVDGFTWMKDEANPIIVPEVFETGNPTFTIYASSVAVDEHGWTLYLSGHPLVGTYTQGAVYRASAPAPSGPWSIETAPIFEHNHSRRWDQDSVSWPSITANEQGLRMLYYMGFGTRLTQIGLATSDSGTTDWVRYDHPDTTQRQVSEGDPVLDLSSEHRLTAYPYVKRSSAGWDMFYVGLSMSNGEFTRIELGYATSPDGITWTRSPHSPLWSTTELPGRMMPIEARVAGIFVDTSYLVYGDFTLDGDMKAINLALWSPEE